MKTWLTMYVLLLAIGLTCCFDILGWIAGKTNEVSKVLEPVSIDNAKKYLLDFGYAEPGAIRSSGSSGSFTDTLKSAVRKFQEFAGLAPSGELDIRTRKKMAIPRCGVFDVRALSSSRDDLFKWKKTRLTYSIFTYSTDLPQSQIKQAIRKAFDTWSAVTPLDFIEISNQDESADIKVKFASASHGDPWPFDGKGGVLAHATLPTSGLLHFDEAESWVYMDADKIASYRYTDLLPVAMHEIGHVLGLEHARTEDSIMAPFYQETVDNNGNYVMPKLHTIDIRNIQDIYGLRRGGFSSDRDSDKSRFGDSDRSGGFSGRSRFGSDDEEPTTTRRPSSGHGSGLFGSLWSKWFGHGDTGSTSNDRDRDRERERNRTPKQWSSWDREDDNSFFSGAGFGSGTAGFGRDHRSTVSSTGGLNSDTSLDGNVGKCPNSVDAVCNGPNRAVYLFEGSKVHEIHGGSVTRVHSLRLLFPSGPIYVEAAYYNSRSQTMTLFQSFQVFVFDYTSGRFSLDPSYPKRIPPSVGFNPTGASEWADGSHILFSRSDDFAVYDEYWNKETKTDKISRYFPGMPRGIRGGLSTGSSLVDVFTQTKVQQYDTSRKMPVGSTQSIQEYLRC